LKLRHFRAGSARRRFFVFGLIDLAWYNFINVLHDPGIDTIFLFAGEGESLWYGQIVNWIDKLARIKYDNAMYIERILAKQLKDSAAAFPVVALTGPRQSGKTTLVRHTFPQKKYVTLEDLDTRAFAQKDPRGFLNTYGTGAILDEVQRVPELFSYLQGIVDEAKHAGQFILAGSQNFLLHEGIIQTLAGRVAMHTLLPFSIAELQRAGALPKTSREYLFQGTYPRIYDDRVSPRTWYANYLLTYVERDVRQVKNVSDLGAFQQFLKMCAGRIGSLLNLSSLAHDCGITHNTARAWLSVLEASFVVFLLRPHHRNFNKRLVKMPKLYFYDTGIACALLGIERTDQLETHPLTGGIFESMVVAELIRGRLNRGRAPNIYFWRDKSGHEVDCLIEDHQQLISVEIKAGRTMVEEYLDGLQYWRSLSGDRNIPFLVYGGTERQKRKDVHVIGWKHIPGILQDEL